METCKYGLGAGTGKPTAERRQGVLYRAYAVLGGMADKYGIEAVYNVCAFMPLLGLVAYFLPNLKRR